MTCSDRCRYIERAGPTRYVERAGALSYVEEAGPTRYVERSGACKPTTPTNAIRVVLGGTTYVLKVQLGATEQIVTLEAA